MEGQHRSDGLVGRQLSGGAGARCLTLLLGLGPQGVVDALVLGAVAAGVHAGQVGLHALVDHNGPVDLDARALGDGSVGPHAGRHHHQLGGDDLAAAQLHAGDGLAALDGLDLHAGLHPDLRLSAGVQQQRRGLIVQLTAHQLGGQLQDGHLNARLAQLPGGLQSQHAAADDHSLLEGIAHGLDLLHVAETADGYHALLVVAGDGRDEALAAQGEDELGVGQLEAAVQLHLLILGVHRHHLALQDLDNVLGLIPPGGVQGHLVGGEAGEHGLGEHWALVSRAFVGDKQDAARLVPLPDGLGRADAGAAVAQDDVGVLGIVAEGGLLHLYLHKLVPAHAAHRAGVQRGVENLAAHQAPDQLAGAGALLLLLLHGHVVLGADAAHRAALLVRLEHRAAHLAPHQFLLGSLLLPSEGDKVLGANLTDGTGLRVGVKHRAAHVAAHLPLGSALDGMKVVQHSLGKLHAIFPGLFELVLAGLEAHPEALQGLELELLEALHDVGHALAAPAVAAEGGGHLAPVGAGKHAGGQVPDGLECLAHDGGGAQQEAVGVEELLSHFAGVGLHHVIQAHVDAALVRDTLGNGLGQLAGVAVGADVGNDNSGPGVRIDDGGPLLVSIQHMGNSRIQHRAVAGADHLQLQGTHPLQGIQHEALEGANDAVVVILGSLPVALLVGNGAG